MTVRTLRRRALAALAVVLLAPVLALATARAPAGASEPRLIVRGGGWGHGVGMSQYGAQGLALQGRTFAQILQHYYTGVAVRQVAAPAKWSDVRVLLDPWTSTHEIIPTTAVTVSYPGGSRTVQAGQVLAIGGNRTTLWIKINGNEIAAPSASSGGVRASVTLNGNPVTLRRNNGTVIGEYRLGRLEVSTGVGGCATSNCAVVRNLTMDQYLYGLAEMPSGWHTEALKAQAVAGRSFADPKVGTSSTRLYDLQRSVTDQVYAGARRDGDARWRQAVDQTSRWVVQVGSTTVGTHYFSSSGGHTENSETVWPNALSYARGVPDPFDNVAGNPNHSWTREYTLREIGSWFGVANVRDVRVVGSVGVSGRIDKATVEIVGSTTRRVSGTEFRSTIGTRAPGRALLSTKITMSTSSFPDVPPNSYYATPVRWLVDEGITTGVGDTGLFKPDDPVTRAQMVTFLWRMMGQPGGFPAHGFADVPSSSYYDAAVRWAKANGITTGVSGTNRFAPNDVVNRAQMSVFLHRTAGLKPASTRHGFPDVPRTSYYDAAVSWASQYGITTGVGDTGLYKPLERVTRGQMAAFLHRTAGTGAAWAGDLPPTAP